MFALTLQSFFTIFALSSSLSTIRADTMTDFCNLAGEWNGSPGGDNTDRVQITQSSGSPNLILHWWMPNPTNVANGTISIDNHMQFNNFDANISTSLYPNAESGESDAGPCTFLKFKSGNKWCKYPFCPTLPPPFDPETVMPSFTVPGAQDIGAIYPNGLPAYYFMNQSSTSTNGWIIHLSGGGWRFMKNNTIMMHDGVSSVGHCYGKCDGILSNNADMNPLFHNWTKVWIPISGTSFTGDRESLKPYPVRGKRILDAVITDLLSRFGMSSATNIILTGGSSGGLATYLTCDRVGGKVFAANASTRFTCLPDAGFFLDHNDSKGQPSTTPLFKDSYYAWNSSGGTNQRCVEHYQQSGQDWKCIFAQYVLPFIQSELFVMQNLYDSWQLRNILKIGCSGYQKPLTDCNKDQMATLQSYGTDMRAALEPAITNNTVGIFAPSCIAHCQSVQNEHSIALWYWPGRWSINVSQIQSQDTETSLYPRDAFNAWYSGKVHGKDNTHVQSCDWSPDSCNKLCPMFT